MSCPRGRKWCKPGHPCVGCKRAAERKAEERARELAKVYCNAKRSDGWPCDRDPHDGGPHRNMVCSEMWLDGA
jgi:hypothetical protein